MLITKVTNTIKKYRMLGSGDRLLVAVSGGPDSVCLLAVLSELTSIFKIQLHIAHLDHMFRGEESAAEARFVSDLAKKFGVSSTIEQYDVPSYCRRSGLSSQAGARHIRYAFFNRIAQTIEASAIATGHTATDQAETLLIRLLRGAGVSGLAAIPPKRDNIIRPLIEITKDEVLQHLRSRGLSYVTDSSNTKPLYTRNRIRLELLPVLESFNPRIVETLAIEVSLLRDEDEAMQAYLDSIIPSVCVQEHDTLVIHRTSFNALLPALRRRLLRKVVEQAHGVVSEMSATHIDAALTFLAKAQTGRSTRLACGLAIERAYDRFVITAAKLTDSFARNISIPGVTLIPELNLVIDATLRVGGEVLDEGRNYFWQAVFDYDKIGFPLSIRNRRAGDWFCPAGMSGKRKKLQDYFVDDKIPRRKRDRIPVLCTADAILWIIGYRTDERFLPGPHTKRILKIGVTTQSENEYNG